MQESKSDMDNMNLNQKNNRPNREGQNNPMWQRHHSQQTKNIMSQKARERAEQYKKMKDSQHHISMDEFLSNHPTVEEYIKTLVKEEIDKFISNECKKQSPPLNIWL